MGKIKVHILHCGKVRVDETVPNRTLSKNPFAYTGFFRGKKHQIWIPVSAYLIEHPKGLVLVDTGWHSDVRTNARAHLGTLHWLVNKSELPEGQAIDEQLSRLGYTPKDIDYVVLSHLHSDHVSGLQLLKNAKKILVSDWEWKEAHDNPIMYVSKMWQGIPMEKFSFTSSGLGPEGKSFDLLGDGSIQFVHCPGHTLGIAATLIQNEDKFLILASDVGYFKNAWKDIILPGITSDKEKAITSLQWIKKMSEKPECIEVIANHDPEIEPKTIEI